MKVQLNLESISSLKESRRTEFMLDGILDEVQQRTEEKPEKVRTRGGVNLYKFKTSEITLYHSVMDFAVEKYGGRVTLKHRNIKDPIIVTLKNIKEILNSALR